MKKLIIILFLFFILTACTQNDSTQTETTTENETTTISEIITTEATDTEVTTVTTTEDLSEYQELAETDINAVEIPEVIEEINQVTSLNLRRWGMNGTTFVWSTSHPELISKTGFVQNPSFGSDPIDVTLSLSAFNGPYSTSRTYQVTVNPCQDVGVTSSTSIPFINITDQYDIDDVEAVEVFYVNEGAVPYIDLQTYINMLDGVLNAEALTVTPVSSDKLEISYTPVLRNFYLFYSDITYDMLEGDTEEFTAVFDFTENTVTFSSYLFFSKLSHMNNPVESQGIEVDDVEYEVGDEFTIPLGDYYVDILMHNDGEDIFYLAPYHLVDLLFTTTVFYNTYYTPERLVGEEVAWDIDNESIITSSLNGEPIPYDVRRTSFYLLLMSLDYFNFMKDHNEVDSYLEMYSEEAETIIESTDSKYYTHLSNIIRELDDLHSIGASNGFYAYDPSKAISTTAPYGVRMTSYYENYSNYYTALSTIHGDWGDDNNRPTVRYLDDDKTAIIYFYNFNRSTPTLFQQRLDALPANIENVVLDTSFNTGGNLGAAFRTLGHMTDEILLLHIVNLTNNSEVTYHISNTQQTYDYNWYIMISSISCSAGSGIAGIAQENNVATVIGETSHGSSSIYDVVSLPCGFIYTLSSYNTFSGYDGTSYVSLEEGVEPDYYITDLTNDQEVIDAIILHQSEE